MSQFPARYDRGIAFGVHGGDACAEAAGGQSIQQWALNVISTAVLPRNFGLDLA